MCVRQIKQLREILMPFVIASCGVHFPDTFALRHSHKNYKTANWML